LRYALAATAAAVVVAAAVIVAAATTAAAAEENDYKDDEPEAAVVTTVAKHDCSFSPHMRDFQLCRSVRAGDRAFISLCVKAIRLG